MEIVSEGRAMATTKADMQRLIAQRDQLLREVEALRNKVAGIEIAISLLETDGASKSTGKRQAGLKSLILGMLEEVGTMGVNAASAVELADRRGITIQAASVSSTLSRFKKDGLVAYDGDRYRLTKFVPQGEASGTTVRRAWTTGARVINLSG
jgi:hypothetical protein